MSVFGVSRKPAISVPPTASVHEALQVMADRKVGAVVVVDDGKAAGIFTRRDAIERVVLEGRSPKSTEVSTVMTSPVEVLPQDTELSDALQFMAARPFNHIPIVDEHENVVGLATTKPIMKHTIERLSSELGSLEAYITADGIGG